MKTKENKENKELQETCKILKIKQKSWEHNLVKLVFKMFPDSVVRDIILKNKNFNRRLEKFDGVEEVEWEEVKIKENMRKKLLRRWFESWTKSWKQDLKEVVRLIKIDENSNYCGN